MLTIAAMAVLAGLGVLGLRRAATARARRANGRQWDASVVALRRTLRDAERQDRLRR